MYHMCVCDVCIVCCVLCVYVYTEYICNANGRGGVQPALGRPPLRLPTLGACYIQALLHSSWRYTIAVKSTYMKPTTPPLYACYMCMTGLCFDLPT